MTSIKELFKKGDRVEWITIHRNGRTIDIKKHSGVIDEIVGSDAMVKTPGRISRKRISLFELKNITRPYEGQNHKWPGSIG